MKLFLLKQTPKDGEGVAYDEYESVLVRAANSIQARQLVTEYDGGNVDLWMNESKSSCEEVNERGKATIIIGAFNAG